MSDLISPAIRANLATLALMRREAEAIGGIGACAADEAMTAFVRRVSRATGVPVAALFGIAEVEADRRRMAMMS